jgi:rubredoxin
MSINTVPVKADCPTCGTTFDRSDPSFGITCQTPLFGGICGHWVCPACADNRRDAIICKLGYPAEKCFLREPDPPAILIS